MDGWPGFEVRVLSGHVIVTGMETSSSGGVKPGWEVLQASGADLLPIVAKLQTDPGIHELQLERAVAARLAGPVSALRPMVFADETGARVTRNIKLVPPRGEFSGLWKSASAAGLV